MENEDDWNFDNRVEYTYQVSWKQMTNTHRVVTRIVKTTSRSAAEDMTFKYLGGNRDSYALLECKRLD